MNQPTRRSHIQQAPSLFSSLLPLFLLLLSLLLFSSPSSLLFVSSSFPGVPPHPDSVFLWNDGLQLDPAGLKLDLHFYNENTLQPGKKLVFTKGDRAYIFDVINWQVIGESSIAKVHRGEVPLWRVGYMDCVIQWPMSNAFYFFTGDRYFRGDSNADLSTNTWSSSLITLEWEGLPSNLHACINLGSTRAIFIYKDKIYHYNSIADEITSYATWPISIYDYFPGLPPLPFLDDLEMNPGTGKLWIFSQNHFYTFDPYKNRMDDIDPSTGVARPQTIVPESMLDFLSTVYNDTLLHPNEGSSLNSMTSQNESSIYRRSWNTEWTNHESSCDSQHEQIRSTQLGRIGNCDHPYYYPRDGSISKAGTNPPSLPPELRSQIPDPRESQDPPPEPNAPPKPSEGGIYPPMRTCRWKVDVPHVQYLPKQYAFEGYEIQFDVFDLIPTEYQVPPSSASSTTGAASDHANEDRVDIFEYFTLDGWSAMRSLTYQRALSTGTSFYPSDRTDDELRQHPAGIAYFTDPVPPISVEELYGVQINNPIPITTYINATTTTTTTTSSSSDDDGVGADDDDEEQTTKTFPVLTQRDLINTAYLFNTTNSSSYSTMSDTELIYLNRRLVASFRSSRRPKLFQPIHLSRFASSFGIEFHTFQRDLTTTTSPSSSSSSFSGTGFNLYFGLITSSRQRYTSLYDLITFSPIFKQASHLIEIEPSSQTPTTTRYLIHFVTTPYGLIYSSQVSIEIYKGWNIDLKAPIVNDTDIINNEDSNLDDTTHRHLLFTCSGRMNTPIHDKLSPGGCDFSYVGPITLLFLVGEDATREPSAYLKHAYSTSSNSPYEEDGDTSSTTPSPPTANFSALITVEYQIVSTCAGLQILNDTLTESRSEGTISDGSGSNWAYYHTQDCLWWITSSHPSALFIAIDVTQFLVPSQPTSDIPFVSFYDTNHPNQIETARSSRILTTVDDHLQAQAEGSFLSSTPNMVGKFHADARTALRITLAYTQGFKSNYTIYYTVRRESFQLTGWQTLLSFYIDEELLRNTMVVQQQQHGVGMNGSQSLSIEELDETLYLSNDAADADADADHPGLYLSDLPFTFQTCCTLHSTQCCSKLGFLPTGSSMKLEIEAKDMFEHKIPFELVKKYKVYFRFIPMEMLKGEGEETMGSSIEQDADDVDTRMTLRHFLISYPQPIHTLCSPHLRQTSKIWKQYGFKWEGLLDSLQWIDESELERTDHTITVRTPSRAGEYELHALLVVDPDCHLPTRLEDGTSSCHGPIDLPLHPIPRLIHVYAGHADSKTSFLKPFVNITTTTETVNETSVVEDEEEDEDENPFTSVSRHLSTTNTTLLWNDSPIRFTLTGLGWIQLLEDPFTYRLINGSLIAFIRPELLHLQQQVHTMMLISTTTSVLPDSFTLWDQLLQLMPKLESIETTSSSTSSTTMTTDSLNTNVTTNVSLASSTSSTSSFNLSMFEDDSTLSQLLTCPIRSLNPSMLQNLLQQYAELQHLHHLLLDENGEGEDDATIDTVQSSLSLAVPPLMITAGTLIRMTLSLADSYGNPIEIHPNRFDIRVFVHNSRETLRVELLSNVEPYVWKDVLEEVRKILNSNNNMTTTSTTTSTTTTRVDGIDVAEVDSSILSWNTLRRRKERLRRRQSSLTIAFRPTLASTQTSMSNLHPFALTLPSSLMDSSYDEYKVTVLVSRSDVSLSPFRIFIVPNVVEPTHTVYKWRTWSMIKRVLDKVESSNIPVTNATINTNISSLTLLDPLSLPTDTLLLVSIHFFDSSDNLIGGWSAFGGLGVKVRLNDEVNINNGTNSEDEEEDLNRDDNNVNDDEITNQIRTASETNSNEEDEDEDGTSNVAQPLTINQCLTIRPFHYFGMNISNIDLSGTGLANTHAEQNTSTGVAHFLVTFSSCLRTFVSSSDPLTLRIDLIQYSPSPMSTSPSPYSASSSSSSSQGDLLPTHSFLTRLTLQSNEGERDPDSTPVFALVLMLACASVVVTILIFFNCCARTPLTTSRQSSTSSSSSSLGKVILTKDEAFISALEEQDYKNVIIWSCSFQSILRLQCFQLKRQHCLPILYTLKESYQQRFKHSFTKEIFHLLSTSFESCLHIYVSIYILRYSAHLEDEDYLESDNLTMDDAMMASQSGLIASLTIAAIFFASFATLIVFVTRCRTLASYLEERKDGTIVCLTVAARGSDVSPALRKVILEIETKRAVHTANTGMTPIGMPTGTVDGAGAGAGDSPPLVPYDDPRVKLAYLKRTEFSLLIAGLSFAMSSVPMILLECYFLFLSNHLQSHLEVFIPLFLSLLLIGWKTLPLFTLLELRNEAEQVKKAVWIEAWKMKQRQLGNLIDTEEMRASSEPPPSVESRIMTATAPTSTTGIAVDTATSIGGDDSGSSTGSLPAEPLTPLSAPSPLMDGALQLPAVGTGTITPVPALWSYRQAHHDLPFTHAIHRLVPTALPIQARESSPIPSMSSHLDASSPSPPPDPSPAPSPSSSPARSLDDADSLHLLLPSLDSRPSPPLSVDVDQDEAMGLLQSCDSPTPSPVKIHM